MEIARLVLDYIKVILSWPVVVGALVIFFILRFRGEIVAFMGRITEAGISGAMLKAIPASQSDERIATPTLLEADKQSDEVRRLEPEIEPTPQRTHEPQTGDLVLDYIVNNPEKVRNEYNFISNRLEFERILNLIYGSQLALLGELSRRPLHTASYDDLFRFYTAFKTGAPLAKAEYREDYLKFLESQGLIRIDTSDDVTTVSLTSRGIDFVSHVLANYPGMKKPL